MGGMIVGTVLAIFFVPLFFVVVLELVAGCAARDEPGRAEPASRLVRRNEHPMTGPSP